MSKKFEYTYSAPTEEERKEIENIRSEYIFDENSKSCDLTKLRKLDAKVKKPPLILSLALGILGTLVFGLGITFSTEWANLAAGISVGIVGAAIMTANPFIYKIFLSKRKEKYREEVFAISDRLLKTENSATDKIR